MKQPNPMTALYGADDFQRLIGFKISNAETSYDEDAREGILITLTNDYGVSIDMCIDDDGISANQPYISEK